MGNVLAASAPPPPPPPPPGPGLMPNLGKPDPSTDVYAPTEASSQVENPGTIEDLHKKCKGTLLVRALAADPRALLAFALDGLHVIFHFITENFLVDCSSVNQQLMYHLFLIKCLSTFSLLHSLYFLV